MSEKKLNQRLIADLMHLVKVLQTGTKDEVKEAKASVRESETRLLIRSAS